MITATYSNSGMLYVGLSEILHLPNISQESINLSEDVLLSDQVNCDPLEQLHQRCDYVNKSKLSEAHHHMLFTGSGLPREHLRVCRDIYVSHMQRQRSRVGRKDDM